MAWFPWLVCLCLCWCLAERDDVVGDADQGPCVSDIVRPAAKAGDLIRASAAESISAKLAQRRRGSRASLGPSGIWPATKVAQGEDR